MADKPYDPNDPSTWGPIVGTDANGQPVYANQPNASSLVSTPSSSGASSPGLFDNPFSTDKTVGQNISSGLGAISPDFVTNLFGGSGGSAGAKQTALAQSTVAPSNTAAGDIYNRAVAQASAANAIKSPDKITGVGINAATVDPNAYNAITNTTAQIEDASLRMKAYQAAIAQASDAAIGNVRQANVSNVAAVPGADVAKVNTRVDAPTVGDAAQTGAVKIERTQLDPLANQLRESEIKAAQDIAAGPSSAMQQFQAGESQVVSDQLSAAAASRGAERAGARREAMINIGAKGAQNALAAAALASQEEQAKRVASANALSGIRSQDVTSATNAASITAQQQNLQAQLDSAIAQGNTAAINAIKEQQAQLSLQAQTASVQAGLSQQGTLANVAEYNTGLQQQKAITDAAAKNKAAMDYATAANAAYSQFAQNQSSASLANASAATGASKDYAGAYNAAAQTAASQQSATNLANAALAQSQAQANAARAAGIATTNAGAQNTVNTTNAANTIAVQGTNATNQLTADQLRQQSATAALNAGTAAISNEVKNAQTVVDANKSGAGADAATDAANKGMIAAGIAKLSDERAKRDIERLTPYDTRHWAESIEPITWRYKDGYEDSGKDVNLGVSAQEVKNSGPLGKLMVHKDPSDDMLHVDYGALTLMLSKTALDVANEALERAKGKQARRAV